MNHNYYSTRLVSSIQTFILMIQEDYSLHPRLSEPRLSGPLQFKTRGKHSRLNGRYSARTKTLTFKMGFSLLTAINNTVIMKNL